MKEKVKYQDGKLIVDIIDMTDLLTPEDKQIFFEDIVFEESIIKMFTDFVSYDNAFDRSLYITKFSSGTPIERIADNVRKKLLGSYDEMFKVQIDNMQKDLDYEAERANRFYGEKSTAIADLNYAKDRIKILEDEVNTLRSTITGLQSLETKDLDRCGQ